MKLRTCLSLAFLAAFLFACGGNGDGEPDATTDSGSDVGSDVGSDTTDTNDGGEEDPGTSNDPGTQQDPGKQEDTTQGFLITPGTPQNDLEMVVGADVRTYRLYVPADYDPANTYPIIYQLHNYSPQHYPEQQPIYASSDALVEEHGFILVLPRANWTGSGYSWMSQPFDKSDNFLVELHELLAGELSIDPERVFLIGDGNSAQYVSRSTRFLGDVYTGFAFLNGAQQSVPDASKIPENKIYIGTSLLEDYQLTYGLNFADALEEAGWVPGENFAINVYPGSNPQRYLHLKNAVRWLDPSGFPDPIEVTGSALTPVELPAEAMGSTKRITAFVAGTGGTIYAVGLRNIVLMRDATEGTWSSVESPFDTRDFYSACYGNQGLWVGGTENAIANMASDGDTLEKYLGAAASLKQDAANRKPGLMGLSCAGDEIWIGASSDVAVSVDGGASWETKEGFNPAPGAGSGTIVDIATSGGGEGWLLAMDGTVYHSTDGGINWNEPEPDFPAEDEQEKTAWWLEYSSSLGVVPWQGMSAISSPEATKAVTIGASGTIRVRAEAKVWNDADVPESLSAPTTGATDGSGETFAVYFYSATNGCIGGQDGLILETVDGGATWTSVDAGPGDDISAIYCDDDEILVGAAHGAIHKYTKCAPVTCQLFCENGFEVDENGCEVCSCVE